MRHGSLLEFFSLGCDGVIMRRKALVIFAALLLRCRALPPLALHQLVEVEPGGEVVLKLHGLDFEGDAVSLKTCIEWIHASIFMKIILCLLLFFVFQHYLLFIFPSSFFI
jgi:hypothetical protein